jgi:signal transduction histidine kinase
MIDTIIRNLLFNALKYSYPNGKIVISAQVQDHIATISVKDNGIGITRHTLEKLFRKDTKVTSAPGTNNEKGSGLGLIICQEFIQAHHSKIWAESYLDEGSTFSFTLEALP